MGRYKNLSKINRRGRFFCDQIKLYTQLSCVLRKISCFNLPVLDCNNLISMIFNNAILAVFSPEIAALMEISITV